MDNALVGYEVWRNDPSAIHEHSLIFILSVDVDG